MRILRKIARNPKYGVMDQVQIFNATWRDRLIRKSHIISSHIKRAGSKSHAPGQDAQIVAIALPESFVRIVARELPRGGCQSVDLNRRELVCDDLEGTSHHIVFA